MAKKVLLDIMLGGKFICQLSYDKRGYPEVIDGEVKESHRLEDLERFVFEKRPSLRGKDIRIEFSNQKT